MSKEETGYTMQYRHCGQEWEDTWSCACNSDCPVCGAEIEPYDYEEDDEETPPSESEIAAALNHWKKSITAWHPEAVFDSESNFGTVIAHEPYPCMETLGEFTPGGEISGLIYYSKAHKTAKTADES
jgi:hypothetical protein